MEDGFKNIGRLLYNFCFSNTCCLGRKRSSLSLISFLPARQGLYYVEYESDHAVSLLLQWLPIALKIKSILLVITQKGCVTWPLKSRVASCHSYPLCMLQTPQLYLTFSSFSVTPTFFPHLRDFEFTNSCLQYFSSHTQNSWLLDVLLT